MIHEETGAKYAVKTIPVNSLTFRAGSANKVKQEEDNLNMELEQLILYQQGFMYAMLLHFFFPLNVWTFWEPRFR